MARGTSTRPSDLAGDALPEGDGARSECDRVALERLFRDLHVAEGPVSNEVAAARFAHRLDALARTSVARVLVDVERTTGLRPVITVSVDDGTVRIEYRSIGGALDSRRPQCRRSIQQKLWSRSLITFRSSSWKPSEQFGRSAPSTRSACTLRFERTRPCGGAEAASTSLLLSDRCRERNEFGVAFLGRGSRALLRSAVREVGAASPAADLKGESARRSHLVVLAIEGDLSAAVSGFE